MTTRVTEGKIGRDHEHWSGGNWQFAMSLGEDRTVFADTAGELIAFLIPGYDQIPGFGLVPGDDEFPGSPHGHDQALIARYEAAVATASDVQALICAEEVGEGRFDPAAETEETLTALFGDKTIPVESFESWDHPNVPLVLIATDYADFTDRAPVTGNVLWLDPSDEVAYLHSLESLGVIDFYTHDED